MIGNIIQYILYAMVWLTILFTLGGLLGAFQLRKGREVNIEVYIGALSIIGGIAPYVGLFGTVWHIIQALSGIGSGNLNVAAIAQPIGQALYTTLWGLGCAIPAVGVQRIIVMMIPDEPESAPQDAQAGAQ